MRLIDTHCHIDLYPDYIQLVNETEHAQVYTIAVTNTPSVFRQCLALTDKKQYIRTAVGLHPQLVDKRHHELPLMSELLSETKYIGEVGLDFVTQDEQERKLQRWVFAKILDQCATFGNKVLTIHSRRAAGDVVDMIGNSYSGKIILHWYSGTSKVLQKAVSYGFYFSINSSMVTSESGRENISQIPLERLLTESDGPFVKLRGQPARPRDMVHVIEGLSIIYGIDKTEMAKRIYDNFHSMLEQD